MSRYRRASVSGGCYFFTVVAYRRRMILCDDAVRSALRAAIETVRASRPFEIDAWVLLPDHLHCIWTLPEGDADFSTRWMMIKRLVSVACRDDYHRADWVTGSKQKHRERRFGNAVFGNIKFAMKMILQSIWIMCISIRSDMAWLQMRRNGHIRLFIVM